MASVTRNQAMIKSFLKGVRSHQQAQRLFSATSACQQRPRKFEEPLDVPENLVNEAIFTEDHYNFRKSFKKLIDTEINPHCDQWEAEGQFPAHEVFKKLGDAGFLGVNKPTEFGGMGLDFSFNIAMAEELGGCSSGGVSMAVGVQSDMCTPALANFGSDELRHTFLAPSIAGDLVGCLGVSEPGAGSDVASLKTTAKKRGDDYVINGGKLWTTNGMQADWICLLANTSDGDVHLNKSLICVPMNSPGITRQKIPNKLGMKSSDTAQLFFEDVVVPQSNRIGEEGMGFVYQMMQFQDERLWGAANALMGMERAIHETANYTHNRKVFGRSLLDNQVIHFRLAELKCEVEALRSLIYRGTGMYMEGHNVVTLATMAKLKAGRLCREVGDSCLQYWGGMGYTDIWIGRFMRDVRLLSIGGGADEVMLQILCKDMDTLCKEGTAYAKRKPQQVMGQEEAEAAAL